MVRGGGVLAVLAHGPFRLILELDGGKRRLESLSASDGHVTPAGVK